MKKTLLLAGVACLFSVSANAMDVAKEFRPYIGLDYVYSHADYKDLVLEPKKSYNSGMVSVGTWISPYASLEAFFQQSAEVKSHNGTIDHIKTKFYAYGLDAYGYLPLGCDGFNLLGSLGLANYNMKVKYHHGSDDKQRMGYRVGIGAQFNIARGLVLRSMYRYIRLNTDTIDYLQEFSVGLRFLF